MYVEFDTYRWLEHCGPNNDDHLGYRKDEEVKKWKTKCPIEKTKDYLLNNNLADEKEIQRISLEIDDEIEQAFEFAKSSPFLEKKHLYTSIYSD